MILAPLRDLEFSTWRAVAFAPGRNGGQTDQLASLVKVSLLLFQVNRNGWGTRNPIAVPK